MMKKVAILTVLLTTILFGANSDDADAKKKKRVEKQVQIELKNNEKYAKEQTFYRADNYDFKGAEVNPDSLDTVNEIEVDDFDMDSVYD